ncbi:MAG: hypothetical protein HWQ41_14130 [Nostoc sp. NOS(2021)]|uniref:hypothetical protein n=1 Tax=Nostoc sp. NOS(2021) TaxID=2815407 RepID=UPI0025D29B3E|nr:hypothetical protein [Nostoc sp. NOS(2021)]MBN3896354.1 hypothetical protein [Nostoc sp. NOS(2021)]
MSPAHCFICSYILPELVYLPKVDAPVCDKGSLQLAIAHLLPALKYNADAYIANDKQPTQVTNFNLPLLIPPAS